MRFLYCLMLFIVLQFPLPLAHLEINELMYNPPSEQGDDADFEWVEIYNNATDPVNLSTYVIDAKRLEGTINPGEFVIVARDKEKFTGFYLPNYTLLEARFSLNNKEDIINLTNGTDSSIVPYSSVWGADGNNKTLERRADGTFGEGLADYGTPGAPNSLANVSADLYPWLIISEVHPDPFEEDNKRKPWGEWVELYNYGDHILDLRNSQLFFLDLDNDSELYITEANVLNPFGLFLYPDSNLAVYRDGDSDFALNNVGYEEVRLMHGDQELHWMSYSGSVEGMSWSNIDGNWFITEPSPDESNWAADLSCDWFLALFFDNSIYHGDDFSFTLKVERFYGLPENVTVRGQIEDINGHIVREYAPLTDKEVESIRHVTYTPNLPEGTYQISFWLEELECEEDYPDDNTITSLVAINPLYKESESSLTIDRLYLGNDEEAAWGDQFTAKVVIYKGDETRQAVLAWAEMDGEKISKTTRLNIYDPYKEYPLTIPFQLDPNCDRALPDGQATLVVEAFGLREEEPFAISGLDTENCGEKYVEYVSLQQEMVKGSSLDAATASQSLESSELYAVADEHAGDAAVFQGRTSSHRSSFVVYESSSAKAKKLIPYLLVGVISLFCILLFRKP